MLNEIIPKQYYNYDKNPPRILRGQMNNSYDQQNYFQKLQQAHQVEERNQKLQDINFNQKMDKKQYLVSQNNDFTEKKSTKARTSTNIELPQEDAAFNPLKRQMMESKSALIQSKKQQEGGVQIPKDLLCRFNVSPARKSQNSSLPPIDFRRPTHHSPSKSAHTTPKHITYPDKTLTNFQVPLTDIKRLPERRIRQSEYQLNQIYNSKQRDSNKHGGGYYDYVNPYHPLAVYNQNVYEKTKRDDEEFRKKLIKQNEKLMHMFQQMQRNHQEEIGLLKLREKHTLQMIKQQQEQINLQNKKIEGREMPPPNFFLAPFQY